MTALAQRPALDGAWLIDPTRSTLAFAIRHLGIATVRGAFDRFAGELVVDETGLQVMGRVNVDSVNTGNAIRDGRLRDEFFAAERFPSMAFAGRVEQPARRSDIWQINGELAIRDVVRPLQLSSTMTVVGRDALRVRAHGELSRAEFGLDWHALREAGRLLVADRVRLGADVVLRRAPR